MTSNNPYVHKLLDYSDKILDLGAKFASEEIITNLKARLTSHNIVEIGSGSGAHLIELARLNPEIQFFGFELRFKRTVRTIEKAQLLGIQNLIMIRGKAEFIDKLFPPKSISKIYINFPDPWDHKRWFKNRIIKEENLKIFSSLLSNEGVLAFKTDHLEYFESAKDIINASQYFEITECTNDLYNSPYLDKNIPTEFEKLFLSQGQKINFLNAVKN